MVVATAASGAAVLILIVLMATLWRMGGQPIAPPDPDPDMALVVNGQLTKEAHERVKRATVHLRVTMPNGDVMKGTGFFGSVKAPNIILTTAHVVGMTAPGSHEPLKIEVFINNDEADGWKTTARVLGVDRQSDLAVLEIGKPPEGKAMPQPLVVKSANGLRELDKVYVFGFPMGEPLGKEITIRPASVSSLRIKDGVIERIQVNCDTEPSNSGSPVVDSSGQVVGMAVSGVPGRQSNLVIPGNLVLALMATLEGHSVRVKPPPKPEPALAVNGELTKEARERIKRATVYLRVTMPNGGRASGTGFFGSVEARNIILTNAHVVGMLAPESRRPRAIEVFVNSGEADEWKTTARVLGVDRSSDLAVLDIGKPKGMTLPKPLVVKSAKGLRVLDEVYVFGFPFSENVGNEMTILAASVSSLRKKDGVIEQVQINGGIIPGNSGGPVVDSSGQVVGVAVGGIPGRQSNFAIPGDRVAGVLMSLVVIPPAP